MLTRFKNSELHDKADAELWLSPTLSHPGHTVPSAPVHPSLSVWLVSQTKTCTFSDTPSRFTYTNSSVPHSAVAFFPT